MSISKEKIAAVLADAASTLRSQQAHINELEEKLASKERHERVLKLASDMHAAGADLDVPVQQLVERLEKVAQQTPGELDALEKALDYMGPNMGSKLAQVADGETSASSSGSNFEAFIMSGVG